MSDKVIHLHQKRILSALERFPAGNIYLLAPRDVVERGFSYHRQNRTWSFEWGAEFSRLTARVNGTKTYAVSVALRNDKPVFSCTCPAWMTSSTCKHIVCVLLTVKNLIQPELFKHRHQTPEYRASLMRGLFGTAAPAPDPAAAKAATGYVIILETSAFGLQVSVECDGEKTSHFLYRVPAALRELAQSGYLGYAKDDDLRRYLEKSGERFPLVYRDGGRDLPLQYDDDLRMTARTHFDARADDGMISVTKRCMLGDEPQEGFLPFERIAFRPGDGRLGIVEDSTGWRLWHELKQNIAAFSDSDDGFDDPGRPETFSLPAELLADAGLTLAGPDREDLERHALFTVDGAPAQLARVESELRLSILPDEADPKLLMLLPECVAEDILLSPARRPFEFFARVRQGFPAAFRTRRRWAVIVRGFFDALAAKNKSAADKIIRKASQEADFTMHRHRRDLREVLALYCAPSQEREEQLVFAGGQWATVSADTARQAAQFRIPYELFGAEIFGQGSGWDVMSAKMSEVHEALPVLQERLAHQGIALRYNGKPVRPAAWEFIFEAVRGDEIDWFEIRPEIRCDGKVLDGALLRGLAGKRVIEDDEGVRIVDAAAQRALAGIEAVYGLASRDAAAGRAMVRTPRLRMLDWLALRKSGAVVKLPPEDEEVLGRLMNFTAIEPRRLPERLAAELRPYQRQGYDWLAFLYEHRFGACLADDMGLGKTVQAIALLAGLKEGVIRSRAADAALPHLVVVPPSLLFNWEQELAKFYPAFKLHIHSGAERKAAFDGSDIVLTTYDTLRRDVAAFAALTFHVIIFDEAQAVKNLQADRTGAVRRLSGAFKLSMTGTPLENHLGEYYSIIDLALPGLLGDYREFRPLVKAEPSPALGVVINRTRPFVLRRTKEAVLDDLPPKIETDVYLDLTVPQRALYQRTVERVRSSINDAYRTKTEAQAKIIALTAILKLRQICVSPRLAEPESETDSPKVDFLLMKLGELLEENHSALVFSQFTSFLDILEDGLRGREIPFQRLDGSTPVAKRKHLVKEFQSGEAPSVFLLSLKAGGQGLNLTRASYVFHLDPWWNPAVEDQASDRAHRIGQRNTVTITRLLMRHTIEEKMMELKKRKRALYDAILSDSAAKGGFAVTREDFDFLLDTGGGK